MIVDCSIDIYIYGILAAPQTAAIQTKLIALPGWSRFLQVLMKHSLRICYYYADGCIGLETVAESDLVLALTHFTGENILVSWISCGLSYLTINTVGECQLHDGQAPKAKLPRGHRLEVMVTGACDSF